MKIDELIALLPEDKKEDAKQTLEKHGAVDAKKVNEFLKTDEGSKVVQPLVDSAVTKALKTYEKNFMDEKYPAMLEAEIAKRHPDQTPEQKRIAALEADNAKTKNELARERQIARAQKLLATMGIPVELAEAHSGLTDEETNAKIGSLAFLNIWKDEAVKKKDDEWLAKGGKPGSGDTTPGPTILRSEFDKLSPEKQNEIVKAKIKIIHDK